MNRYLHRQVVGSRYERGPSSLSHGLAMKSALPAATDLGTPRTADRFRSRRRPPAHSGIVLLEARCNGQTLVHTPTGQNS